MTALWIILGIIAFFVFVFSVKVTVYMTYDEDFKLDVRWLFIKLPILPKKEKPEKERSLKRKSQRRKRNRRKKKKLQTRMLR